MSENLWNLPLRDQLAYECFARWGIKIIEYPTVEPITLAEAKLHLRIDDDAGSPSAHPDDPLITGLISAAREWCELYSGLSLALQTIELGGRAFHAASAYRYNTSGVIGSSSTAYSYYAFYIELPMSPVHSIIAVTYTDDAGSEQTVDPAQYVLDDYVRPPRLYAAAGTTWPTAKADSPNVCRIRYLAGYDNSNSSPNPNPLPQSTVAAIKLMLTHLYENRSEVEQGSASATLSRQLPLGAQSLLDINHRIRLGFA